MRCLTEPECEAWLRERNRQRPDDVPNLHRERVTYPAEPHRFCFAALRIATELTHRMPALLWITEWGVWPSSENEHLYYRLRQCYGDLRLLHEAPGHLFLGHESEDLASLLQVSMLNGWGGYVLTQADYVNVRFSHDGFFDFFAEHASNLEGFGTR